MRVSLSNLLYISFLTLPISFKIQFFEGVYLYPQEIVIASIVLLLIMLDYRRFLAVPKYMEPFIYFLIALGLVVACTLISFSKFVDISGMFKAVKYVLYLAAAFLISRHNFTSFIYKFNRIALLSIGLTILLYVFKWVTFHGSTSDYIYLTTWDVEYVPSGFSNLNLDLENFSFFRSAGNHGIYGSYLVLVFILNIHLLITNRGKRITLSIILVFLAVFNLLLLTSRESLLIFLTVNALYFLKDFLNLRIKKAYLYIFLLLLVGLTYILANGINLGLINKIQYTLESFTSSGSEQNLNLRFNVWALILLSFLHFPFHLLIGYGYNQPNFVFFLEKTNSIYGLYEHYATVPESLFFMMLAYGGFFSLLFIILFFISMLLKTYNLRKHSVLHELFFYFMVGIFITNNTGGSLMSDLVLAQFSLFYIFINKFYGQSKVALYNCQS